MPLPRVPLPEPPTHLQNLLDQACDADEKPFIRLTALATLLVRLDGWFEEMAAFCNERGGTLGMDAAGIRKLALENERRVDDSHRVIDVQDGEPSFRDAEESGPSEH